MHIYNYNYFPKILFCEHYMPQHIFFDCTNKNVNIEFNSDFVIYNELN